MRRVFIALLLIAATSFLNAATPGRERPLTADREAMDALYSVMASMPVMDRKVLFHGLTPTAKAELWRIHLEKFAAEHELSLDQKAIVAEAVQLFSPGMYAMDRTSPDWERLVGAPLRAFDERAKNIFSRDLAIEAFAQLGPSDVPAGVLATQLSSNQLVPHVQGLKPGLKPIPLMPSDCSCSTQSDWCWGFSTCGIGGATCYRSVDGGCGTGWQYDCNSRCSYGQ